MRVDVCLCLMNTKLNGIEMLFEIFPYHQYNTSIFNSKSTDGINKQARRPKEFTY